MMTILRKSRHSLKKFQFMSEMFLKVVTVTGLVVIHLIMDPLHLCDGLVSENLPKGEGFISAA